MDLSDVTGIVSIDGLTMGAIWAPGVNLVYNSNVTTNGQWFAGTVQTGPSRVRRGLTMRRADHGADHRADEHLK